MNRENYNEARTYLLLREDIQIFLKETIRVLQQDCTEDVPFQPFEDSYVQQLPKFDFTRLESFILIQELREVLEDENGYACKCIDSFIDGVYTRHTGNCSFEWILRFKNEPKEPTELRRYVESDVWMNDTSWKEKG